MRHCIRHPLAAALAALAFAATPVKEAHAQADAWITGQHAYILPKDLAGVDEGGQANLPVHPPGTSNAYTGQVPQRSQHVRTMGDGRILFFEVDGNLYDGGGWLMADARGPNCQDCLEPGVMEFLSVPVPGTCNLFYLLSAAGRRADYNGTHIQMSVLDMEADNPRFAGAPAPNGQARRGRLLSLEELGSHPQFPNWELHAEGAESGPTSDRMGVLPTTSLGKTRTPMLRVAQQANGDSWLAVVMADRVHLFRINASGIHSVDPLPDHTRDYVQIFSLSDVQTKQFFRDADAVIATDPVSGVETLVLAMTDGGGMKLWPDEQGYYNLVVHRYNAQSGHYLPAQSQAWFLYDNPTSCSGAQPTTLAPPGLRGCALAADGGGVFLTGERTTDCTTWQAFMEYRAFSGTVTDITHVFGASMPPALARTRIHRNSAPLLMDGEPMPRGETIYLPGGTTVGAVYVEDMDWPFFIPDALQGGQAPALVVTDGSSYYLPRFLGEGVVSDSYLGEADRATCCVFLNTHGSGVLGRQELHGFHTWNATSNPFGDAPVITLTEDLVVKPGAHLYVSDITLRFAPDARLIVERGGRVIGTNSTFTSLACPNSRWPGMRVEGNTGNPEQTQTGTPVVDRQGWLYLNGCTVENAEVGVWCAREAWPGTAAATHFGGVVRANSTSFVNCIVGARVERYERGNASGANLPNLSRFEACTFKTTSAWPDYLTNRPGAHVLLQKVQGIRFLRCRFLNETPNSYPMQQRGWGIWAQAAGFDVEGTADEDASLFKGLTAGVVAGGPLHKVNIRRSWFRNNYAGATLMGTTGAEVSRSHFFVPSGPGDMQPPAGVVLLQSTGYVVEENAFDGNGFANMKVGLLIQGDVYDENRIYNNSFTGLAAGTYTKDRQKGYDPTAGVEYAGLQLLCSDYTECAYEYLLGDNTYIKAAQGMWNGTADESQLAGNRFFNGAIPGISISTAQPQGAQAPFFNYLRHNVAECDPHDEDNPYFNDIRIDVANTFTKSVDCGHGLLSQLGVGGGVGDYRLAAAQLLSVKAHFTGTVDAGEKVDIEEAIKQMAPVLPSHTLRDYLLARCPLSDEVLLNVIYREVPMDPWHITQVMLGNAKLTTKVLEALEKSELLNTYMMALVRNAGSGPTVKDLLVEELELRSAEKGRHLTLAVDQLMNDSTTAGVVDTLYAMLAHAPDVGDLFSLARIAMERDQRDLAHAWLDTLVVKKVPGHEELRELLDMQQAVDNDWSQATNSQRARLKDLASMAGPGAAFAWAMRYHLGETQDLPLAYLPGATKRLFAASPRRLTGTAEVQTLQAHPNPTAGHSMVVVGMEIDEPARLHVTDPSGRLVRTLPLAANQQLLEMDLSGLANGLYVIELLVGDMKLGAAKLTLQR